MQRMHHVLFWRLMILDFVSFVFIDASMCDPVHNLETVFCISSNIGH